MAGKSALDPLQLAWQLEYRGLSINAIAVRLGVDPRHLRRVLRGERPGSAELLESIADLIENMGNRRAQEEGCRLISAAVHMFFVKRGKFDSEIFGPGPPPVSAESAPVSGEREPAKPKSKCKQAEPRP